MRQVVKTDQGKYAVQNYVHLHMTDDGRVAGAEFQDESIHSFGVIARLCAWWRDSIEEANRKANEWDDQ